MRVSKEQVAAALKLLGLEFQDAELDMMLPGVNRALAAYEALRKVDVPLDTEPAFTFHPGLPGRVPGKGPARFETTIAKAAPGRPPANLDDLAFLRVTELAPLVRARAVSSTDLTRMYLGRMKKYSEKLLCLITLTEDLALEQAAAADREIRQGHYRGPLHGIPFGVKDLFDTKGILTTWGAEPFQKRVPGRDATVVERLRAAGAVLMAKLSMGALAQGGLWFKGMTKTPWNIERTSSGSSAGSAAATAAGLVGFSLGTETLGSIVSPCIQCGTVGLRPTSGRVSRYGAMGLSWTMDKIGPICRGVEDCALVLNAIHGPDGRDRSVAGDPFHWEPRKPLKSLRVGVVQKAFDRFTGDEKKVYDQALEDLKKADVLDDSGGLHRGWRVHPLPAGSRGRGRLRRHHARWARQGTARAGCRRLAQHLPHVPPDPGSRVHPGAARAHPLDREIRKVHGGLGCDRHPSHATADHH